MSSVEPLTIGLVGTGNRAQTVYKPLFQFLKPWVKLGAVCDPIKQHADDYAQEMGVPAFYSLQEMVASDSIEAALVVAPIDLHHAMSLYLSEHGIHNLVETSMCRLLIQAQEMVQTAADRGVVMRVAENFFRFPFDRIAKLIDKNGFIGPISRVTCFQDHTGYHNNSRWIVFYGGYPEAVQSIEHSMPTVPHFEMAHRYRTQEVYRARFYFFPDDRLVVDHSGNIKGMLGRYLRPGYTELNGARGTIARSAMRNFFGEAEVRYCSDEALLDRAVADEIYPIEHISEEGCWASERVDLPNGRVEYRNPYRVTSGPLV